MLVIERGFTTVTVEKRGASRRARARARTSKRAPEAPIRRLRKCPRVERARIIAQRSARARES